MIFYDKLSRPRDFCLKVPLSVSDHIQGFTKAPIELIQYGDFQCPFCGQADLIVKRLQKVLNQEIIYAFRNFPITDAHSQALGAAEAAEAAGLQGKYWQMHDVLYENQSDLDHESLIAYAKGLGLNVPKFLEDLEGAEIEEKIMGDFYGGARSGVIGTPTFFVNGVRYEGDWNFESFLQNLKAQSARVS